jgi:hypothetical protein
MEQTNLEMSAYMEETIWERQRDTPKNNIKVAVPETCVEMRPFIFTCSKLALKSTG